MNNFIKNIDLDSINKTLTLELEKDFYGKSKLNNIDVSINKIIFTEPCIKDAQDLKKISGILKDFTEKYDKIIQSNFFNNETSKEMITHFENDLKVKEKKENNEEYTEIDIRMYITRVVDDILKLNESSELMILINNFVFKKCRLFAENQEIYVSFDEVFSFLNQKYVFALEEFKNNLVSYFLGFFFNAFTYLFRRKMEEFYKAYQS